MIRHVVAVYFLLALSCAAQQASGTPVLQTDADKAKASAGKPAVLEAMNLMLRFLRFFRLSTALTLILRLYFLRVPVISWLVLLVAGPVGSTQAYAFFSGLLYVPNSKQFFLLSMVTFLLAASCLGSFNLIRFGAKERFNFEIPTGGDYAYLGIAHLAPAVFLVTTARLTRIQAGDPAIVWTGQWAAGFGGYLTAFVVMLFSRGLQLLFTDPGAQDPMSLFLPGGGLFRLGRNLKGWNPPFLAPIRSAFEYASRLLHSAAYPLFKVGYDDKPPVGIAAGHIYAASLAFLSFLIYLTLGVARQWKIDPDSLGTLTRYLAGAADSILMQEALPALAWVFFFLTMAVWILSGVTYCIDRWRIPLFGLIVVAILVTGGNPKTDHYYRTCPVVAAPEYPRCFEAPLNPRPTARELLDLKQGNGKLVLVSAPGGGIQSAAWTTFALSQLEAATNRKLIENVGAISSVSGGSVGVFHLAAGGFDAAKAYQTASVPTIDDVAWGFMVPDVQRVFLPYIRNPVVDRGWALEYASERAAGIGRERGDLNLDSPDIRPGQTRPALILNATMMERGGPIVFSNSEFLTPESAPLPACGPKIAGSGSQDFTDLYGRRIRLVTAARLSASFPYVSPAARTFQHEPLCADYHLQDGGYFDNYGIFSLIKWLRSGLDREHPQFKKILLIRLNAFPEDPAFPSTAGWRGQITDPVDGFLNARETAQANAVDTVVEILKGELHGEGAELITADFRYSLKGIQLPNGMCSNPPLNWVLTASQQHCIETVWNMQMNTENSELQKSRNAVVRYMTEAK